MKKNQKMNGNRNEIITGAAGMIGGLILKQCLENEKIISIRSFVRKPSGIIHSKLTEIGIEDFENLEGLEGYFTDVNVLFFCLGVYTRRSPKSIIQKNHSCIMPLRLPGCWKAKARMQHTVC